MSFRSPLAPDANEGLVALVTGGGTGIGAATARELARTGARVAICGRRPGPIASVRDELERSGAEVLAVPELDVREQEHRDALVEAVLERFGRIDVLVNNAGGQFVAPAEGISLKGWRAVHRLNVDAVWDLTRTVAERSMIPNLGGLVVFIGFSPRRGVRLMVHSAAARAALENLAGGLAIEWSRYGIRAVCVACGAIDTEGFRAYGDAVVEEAMKAVPLGRLGRPEEVASVIAFLASPGGAYITGTTVVVDGGTDAWGFGTPPPPPSRPPSRPT
jgi:citronellol/citronellal dehydrogenase